MIFSHFAKPFVPLLRYLRMRLALDESATKKRPKDPMRTMLLISQSGTGIV